MAPACVSMRNVVVMELEMQATAAGCRAAMCSSVRYRNVSASSVEPGPVAFLVLPSNVEALALTRP